MTSRKDKFGFYQIGDFRTYSKVESIELHKITGIHPHWNFNEEDFSAYDWAVEPTESLEELYAKRAKQIRNDYDYVVLFYSGGADCSNILDTFVNNGIALDEIATVNTLKLDSNPDSFFNAEQVKVSYPRIKQLQDNGVKFKHRAIDLTDVNHQILTSTEYKNNRAYYASAHWGVSHIAKSYIRDVVPDYKKLIESGKKVVFVFGSDKPRLYHENNRYCIKFLDLIDSATSIRTQMLNRDWEYDELFYWAPEAKDIVCKQGHVLKRFFEKYNIYKQEKYYSDDVVTIPDIAIIFDNNETEDKLSYRNLINWLIYPTFDIKTFSLGKPHRSVILSPREEKWDQDNYFNIQQHRLRSHLSQLDTYWWNDLENIDKGLKLCVSPAYYLE